MIRAQLKLLPGAKESKRERIKGDAWRRATSRGAMKQARSVEIIEGKEIRRDRPSDYFIPTGVKVPFESYWE